MIYVQLLVPMLKSFGEVKKKANMSFCILVLAILVIYYHNSVWAGLCLCQVSIGYQDY